MKHILKGLPVLILLVLASIMTTRVYGQGVVPDSEEQQALKDMYDSLGGSAWTNNPYWPMTGTLPANSVQNYGVTMSGGDVNRIWLASCNVTGKIPSSIKKLKKLKSIYLQGNAITGKIPASLGELTEVEILYLSTNQLTGPLPAALGNMTAVKQFIVSRNQLTGAVPAELANLPNVDYLSLGSNNFTSVSDLSGLSTVKTLDLSYLPLPAGPIPTWIFSLPRLEGLYMTGSNRTSIPSEIGNCTTLGAIELATNQITSLPASMGNLTNLTYLNLNLNQITGPLPSWLGNLTKLTSLQMFLNSFTGTLPSWIGNLNKLTVLNLSQNKLAGELPPELGNLTKLQTLYLHYNKFEGTLPSTLGGLTDLVALDLDNNALSGEFPSYVGNWTKLTTLTIFSNKFTGAFPSTLGSCTLLNSTRLDNNYFTSLPSSMLNIPNLNVNAENNELTSIPNFANHINKPGLSVYLKNNRLDFSQLQPIVAAGITRTSYNPQKNIQDVSLSTFKEGNTLIVPGREPGSGTTVIWEKLQSNGTTWSDITAQNEDATRKTFKKSNATKTSDEGTYRWRVTNTSFAGMTILCDPITMREGAANLMDNLAFQYRYDGRKRLIKKKVPGADWVYMVYDDHDRLVLTQDGEQRKANKWTFTKYDELNRPVLTGIKDTAVTKQEDMQQAVNYHYTKSWARYGERYIQNEPGNIHGYSNRSYPITTTAGAVDVNSYLTATYYNDYTFRENWYATAWGSSGSYNYVDDELTTGSYTQEHPGEINTLVMGQVTGTKIKVLDGRNNVWLKTVNYYDNEYRVIQTLSTNYKGGIDRTSNLYDFAGKVLKTKTTHTRNDVTWKDIVAVKQDGNSLVCTANPAGWGNSGAASVQQLDASQNGWIEFVASENTTYRLLGLSRQNTNANFNTIDYAFDIAPTGILYIYENGTPQGTSTTYATGDILRIERNGTTISYYKNGAFLRSSGTASTTALIADVALYNIGSTISGVRTSFSVTSESITRTFDYDHAGRLTHTWHQVGNSESAKILLAKNEYNELGQLVDKKLHSKVATGADTKQSVDYRYNIRGWLTSINNSKLSGAEPDNDDGNDYFGMNLGYNTDIEIGNAPLFNGNISGIKWSNNLGTGTIKEKAYTYTYDDMSRILSSTFREKTDNWASLTNSGFAETGFIYDLNGNIKNLTRNDKRSSGTMDILTYQYGTGPAQSNKLLLVTDGGDDFAGFVDGNPSTTDDYTYDANGNMTRDLNKGIGTSLADATNKITYNYLNLPEVVTKSGNTVHYIYDASGRKLSQVTTYGGIAKQTDYMGQFTYENDALQFINHEEGRVVKASTKLIYSHCGESTTGLSTSFANLNTITLNGTEKYVQITCTASGLRTGVTSVGGSFLVLPGDRYRIRVKGYRAGTSPAYIAIKVNNTDLSWPGAALPSSAATESWVEQIITIPGTGTTPVPLQAGVTWNSVVNNEIMYLNEFEITKLDIAANEYQYHLKDHLGNVRVTFTTKEDVDPSLGTLEAVNENEEKGKFLRYENARKVESTLFDRTNDSSTGYAQRLNGSANEKFGLAKSLSVMPGDVVNMEVFAKYIDSNTGNWTGALNTLLSQIAAGTAPGGTVVDGGGYSASTSSFPVEAGLNNTNESTGAGPKAYLNWLTYDRNYKLIPSKSGYMRLTTAAREYGQNADHERLYGSVTVAEPGYMYIYLSNEEETNPYEVYFDDFEVEHVKSPVIQTDDYYPFGLTFNSYQRENSVNNDYKFQSQEHVDDLGLNWDSFKFRNHQPEIGRFFNIDPLSEKFVYNSPYAFSENKVTSHVELEGTEALDFNTHLAINAGNAGAAAVSYAVDWLYDKIIGGGEKMIRGAQEYTKNEYDHEQYQEGGGNQMIPEDVEQLQYTANKVQSTGKVIEGIVDQVEGYTTLQSLFMGGLEGTIAQGGKSAATKRFNSMVQDILTNPQASADDIAANFTEAGYKASVTEMATGRGQQVTIEGFSGINTIKVHGGGGRHGLARVEISGSKGIYKIVQGSAKNYKGKIQEEIKAGTRFIFTEK